jgi:hypothetical protein
MKGPAGSLSSAFAFVLTMRIVNLFADMTYEGGASINGPFLGTLGASASAIGIVAGVLVIALVMFLKGGGNYKVGHATLLISTVLALVALTIAQRAFPRPSDLERGRTAPAKGSTTSY